MRFSTLFFAIGAITSTAFADKTKTADLTTTAGMISAFKLSSRPSLRKATWNLYSHPSKPRQVRTVSLGEHQRQAGRSVDAVSNLPLTSRSSSRGSWRVYKRTTRRRVAKIISLEEAQRQAEGSTESAPSRRVKARDVDTTVPEDDGSVDDEDVFPWIGRRLTRGARRDIFGRDMEAVEEEDDDDTDDEEGDTFPWIGHRVDNEARQEPHSEMENSGVVGGPVRVPRGHERFLERREEII